MKGTAIHTFGRGSEVLHRSLSHLVLYGNAERKRPAAKAATMEGESEGLPSQIVQPPRQMSRNDEVKTSAAASEQASGGDRQAAITHDHRHAARPRAPLA